MQLPSLQMLVVTAAQDSILLLQRQATGQKHDAQDDRTGEKLHPLADRLWRRVKKYLFSGTSSECRPVLTGPAAQHQDISGLCTSEAELWGVLHSCLQNRIAM